MVSEKKNKGDVVFICDACQLIYKECSWAEECEHWCKMHNSCNLEITQHALK